MQGSWEGWQQRLDANLSTSFLLIPIPKSLLLWKLTLSPEAKWKHLRIRKRFLAFSIDHSPIIKASSANYRCEIVRLSLPTLMPLKMFLFLASRMDTCKASAAKINKKGERGSP